MRTSNKYSVLQKIFYATLCIHKKINYLILYFYFSKELMQINLKI